MSYLNPLRVHFAGHFGAAISTVNNDPLHYDNATFQPAYQEPQSGPNANGWFNPRGSGDWRLFGCRVTSAWLSSGQAAPPDDAIHGATIADSDRRVAAKLVDLDPDQQLVSMIWGLEVRVCLPDGTTLLRGQFEPAAFMHIWDRAQAPAPGDLLAGAAYQSVLTGLEWGDLSSSQTLQDLRSSVSTGLLSIKFNVDGVSLDPASPDFLMGRIVGTIGPAQPGEPRHFVAGRQFMPAGLPTGVFFAPAGLLNSCVATVDRARRKVYLDLGNALPTVQAGGVQAPVGALSVAVVVPAPAGQAPTVVQLAQIPESVYTDPTWYPATAGVVELPTDRQLTNEELAATSANPCEIRRIAADGASAPGVSEYPSGVYVRADQFVFRADPGELIHVRLFASRFGQPYAGARVLAVLDPSQLQAVAPGVPISAIDFPARLVANADGTCVLSVATTSPNGPRDSIDGQVYGVRVVLEETILPSSGYPFNPWEFITLLVWDAPELSEPPTWAGGLQAILQQYANLYPVMQRFLDLSDYDAICAKRRLLILALSLPLSDPNSMPVTRDLSGAKRKAILRWLTEVGPDGRPLRGEPPPGNPLAAVVVAAQPASPVSADVSTRGGKAAAAGRRYALRSAAGRP